MTLLSMLDRFEQAAVTYETSTDKADRDELHAARRAIMERVEELQAEAELNEMMAHDLAGEAVVATIKKSFPAIAAKWEAYTSPPVSEREAELVKALKEANAFILAPAEDLKDGVLSRLRAAIRSAELEVYGRDEHGRELKRPAGLGGVLSEALALLHPSLEQE